MFTPLDLLPRQWLFDVTVISGRRDKYGNRANPDSGRTVTGCTLGPTSNDEGGNDSDVVTVRATLYAPPGTSISSTDRVRTPPGSPLPALWAVDGEPVHWPLGTAIPLRKEDLDA